MTGITFTRCQPLIGAEVGNVDLTQPISVVLADEIRAGLARYQVLVFREQDITREQHRALADLWVANRERPFLIQKVQANPIADYPEIFNVIANGSVKTAADVWHTDESFHRAPPTASILRARVVPRLGGDTVFSSAVAAYDRLPDDIKQKIRSLRALHGPQWQNMAGADPAKVSAYLAANPAQAQPVVRIHPVNARPCLYVNDNYTGPIVGMEDEASRALRDYLVDQFKKPDYQMRVKWQPNTIVVWDNCQVQHYAVYDYNEPRAMERILVAGAEVSLGFQDAEKLASTA
jgi:alpha-ketoglutarate-dependent sulfate ester dioxygenase